MKSEYMPLSDNEVKNINRAIEEIYSTLKDVEGRLGVIKEPEKLWQDKFISTSQDADKIKLIANYLGLSKLEV